MIAWPSGLRKVGLRRFAQTELRVVHLYPAQIFGNSGVRELPLTGGVLRAYEPKVDWILLLHGFRSAEFRDIATCGMGPGALACKDLKSGSFPVIVSTCAVHPDSNRVGNSERRTWEDLGRAIRTYGMC